MTEAGDVAQRAEQVRAGRRADDVQYGCLFQPLYHDRDVNGLPSSQLVRLFAP